jgi:hypothetical protein
VNCVTSISPLTADYSAEMKEATVTVAAPSGCHWSATTSSSFISLGAFGAAGDGNGSFIYRVFGNLTGNPRSGSIQVMQMTSNVTQRAALGGNFLSFVSEPGDYVGQGWTLLHEAPTATFTITSRSSHNFIAADIKASDGLRTLDWRLEMTAEQGKALVAQGYGWAPSFSGDGRGCGSINTTGYFNITNLVFGSDGSVQQLRVDFIQHCEGKAPALTGTLSYVR